MNFSWSTGYPPAHVRAFASSNPRPVFIINIFLKKNTSFSLKAFSKEKKIWGLLHIKPGHTPCSCDPVNDSRSQAMLARLVSITYVYKRDLNRICTSMPSYETSLMYFTSSGTKVHIHGKFKHQSCIYRGSAYEAK